MVNVPNYKATIQEGRTCWFHSLLNGFLLSKYGRRYLHSIVGVGPFNSKNVASKDSCPIEKVVSITNIKPFIRLYMQQGVISNHFKFFVNNSVTKNSGYKLKSELKIFPGIHTVTYKKGQVLPDPTKYILSHAYITVSFHSSDLAHAISGIINSKDEYFLYDSHGQYKQISDAWYTENGIREIKKFFRYDKKDDIKSVHFVLVYVPKHRVDTPTLHEFELERIEKTIKSLQEASKKGLNSYRTSKYINTEKIVNRPLITGTINNRMVREILAGERNWQLEPIKRNSKELKNAKIARIVQLIKNGKRNQNLNIKNSNNHRVKNAKNMRSGVLESKQKKNKALEVNRIVQLIKNGKRNESLASNTNENYRYGTTKISNAKRARIEVLVSEIMAGTRNITPNNRNTEAVKKAKIARIIQLISNGTRNTNLTPNNRNTEAVKKAKIARQLLLNGTRNTNLTPNNGNSEAVKNAEISRQLLNGTSLNQNREKVKLAAQSLKLILRGERNASLNPNNGNNEAVKNAKLSRIGFLVRYIESGGKNKYLNPSENNHNEVKKAKLKRIRWLVSGIREGLRNKYLEPSENNHNEVKKAKLKRATRISSL